jgi:3-oxoacyl-[acyl-carrier-protein] synthase-1
VSQPFPVYVRASSLSCALGLDLAQSLAALQRGEVNARPIELAGLAEPVRMPYYRIPDGMDLFDLSRFETWVCKAAAAVLQEAQLSAAEIAGLPVFVGSSSFTINESETLYRRALDQDPAGAYGLPIIGYQQIADVLRKNLGLVGESFAFNTACTASANGLLYAARMISLGRYSQALVLGVELANRTTLAGFSGLQLVADVLRPFDLRRNGIVLGEGVGAVLLSRQAPAGALRLLGGASNSDSFSVTTANPDGGVIARLLQEAFQNSGVQAGDLRAIKAHGTGSPMNDTGEAAAIHQSLTALPPICALKPFLGHTLGACGVNELALFGAALQAGFLPGAPGSTEMDPALAILPLHQPQAAPSGSYLLNYFGFGGSNTALLVEKADG